MKIKISELKESIIKTLTSTYYSEAQAEKIAEVLIAAELSGKNTQGIIKLTGVEPIQSIKPEGEPEFIKDTKVSALINGHHNPGILVAHIATQTAIDKAKEVGVGIVGTNNTFSSTGMLSFYASEIAKNDLIGVVMSGSPGSVAPHGGIEPLFGTNPVGFGFPTREDPLVFDMATSAITWYGLVRAKALGEKLPENVAIDSDGNLTTDPESAMNGAILPFDRNYKGSGLSMMVETLTGPLVGAGFADKTGNADWGNLFIAIDPEVLIGKEEFKKTCSELVNLVRNSKTKPGSGKVRMPGEESILKMRKAIESGEMEIDEAIFGQLTK